MTCEPYCEPINTELTKLHFSGWLCHFRVKGSDAKCLYSFHRSPREVPGNTFIPHAIPTHHNGNYLWPWLNPLTNRQYPCVYIRMNIEYTVWQQLIMSRCSVPIPAHRFHAIAWGFSKSSQTMEIPCTSNNLVQETKHFAVQERTTVVRYVWCLCQHTYVYVWCMYNVMMKGASEYGRK